MYKHIYTSNNPKTWHCLRWETLIGLLPWASYCKKQICWKKVKASFISHWIMNVYRSYCMLSISHWIMNVYRSYCMLSTLNTLFYFIIPFSLLPTLACYFFLSQQLWSTSTNKYWMVQQQGTRLNGKKKNVGVYMSDRSGIACTISLSL